MSPTNELRFVERVNSVEVGPLTYRYETIRVLQQKWVEADRHEWPATEWRDVPLVKEET